MRTLHLILFCLAIVSASRLQSQTPSLPANYSSGVKVSYVRTWDALKPESNTNNITAGAVGKDFRMTTQYLDGLGRALQTVIKQGSQVTGGTAADLVMAQVYDELGREVYKFLSSPANSTGSNTSINDGLFKLNPFAQQAAFYGNSFSNSPIAGQGQTFYYGQTKFEASPLNRVTETFAPGNSWAGTAAEGPESNRRSIKIKYYTNTVKDSVRIWTVTDPGSLGNWGTYATSAKYAAGALYKTITIDENNKQVIEFKDKQGLVILKKVQIGGTGDDGTGADHGNNWLCTYYIYDDLSRLRCVIQPQGVRQINTSWLPNAATLNEHCFRYEYDERSRMIMKRLPGVALGEVYMVYDARDRLVMTQDGNMRVNNKWMVNKYDSLNRPVENGLWTSYAVFSIHRNNAGSSITYPTTSSGYEQLSISHYDDYTNLPGGLTTTLDNIGSSELYTSYNTSPEYAQALSVTGQTRGLVTWSQSKVLGTASDFISTVNLYDEKGRLIQTKTKNNTGGVDISTTQYNWAGQPIITVNKTEKAGTNTQTITVVNRMSYDDLARLIKVDKKIAHSGINSGALSTNWVTILEQEYDAIGQVKKKTIGNKKTEMGLYYSPRQPLQELVYDYNIRGWLLGTNRDYLTSNDQTTDGKLFGFELGYDNITSKASNSFSAAQYNGNIGGMTWKSDGDDIRRRYDFSYDAANRLLKAEFKQNNSGTTTWNKTVVDFTVQMGNSGADDGSAYDANGNILKMKQWGLKLTGPTQIDNLTYTYHAGGNRLKAVTESGTGTTDHKLGDFTDKNTSATDYGYDRNGNLVIDLNKQLKGTVAPNTDMLSGGAILYNHLNLPIQITVRNDANTADKGTISYVYDAAGSKLQKITTENSVSVTYNGTAYTTNITTTTTYLNGVVFESKQYSDATVNTGLGYTDRLQFFGQEEGRIRAVNDPANPNTLTGLEYDYMIKDHLGNVRMVLTEQVKQDEYPAATMETAQAATENTFYSNLEATRVNRPSGYTDTYTDPNDKVALVRGDGNKIGPAILLKVMAGDRFNIHASAWWTGSSSGSNTSPLTSIVSALISSAPDVSGGKIGISDLTSTILDPQVNLFLTNDQPAVSGKPKAYLNWILFDEQFKYVGNGNSGAEVVEASGIVKHFSKPDMPVNQNGYLYIYTSNETSYDVFFDNLQVTHVRGPLLEETHYYPFGLTMAGISSKALEFGNPKNKEQTFQGQRFDDELGLNWVQFKWRNHDPQIGRFIEIDPLANDYVHNSPYAFSENKVTAHIELEGLEAIPLFGNSSIISNTVALEGNNVIPKPAIENIVKSSVETGNKSGSSKMPAETLQNFSRGRSVEAEQLAKNGLEKNNTPIEVVDPKTGKTEITVPDAFKNGGQSTSEIKNVKGQSLSRQLRLQEKYSNDNGFNPELIINKGAKLSEPLKNSSFEIKYYNYTTPAIDNTGQKPVMAPVEKQQKKTNSMAVSPDRMA
jgi:RHS repeat-associated protein